MVEISALTVVRGRFLDWCQCGKFSGGGVRKGRTGIKLGRLLIWWNCLQMLQSPTITAIGRENFTPRHIHPHLTPPIAHPTLQLAMPLHMAAFKGVLRVQTPK